MPTGNDDPIVRQFREQIAAIDLEIVAALNRRVALVKQLHAHKAQHGYDFVDPAREEWMRAFVSRANEGPLSDESLIELYSHLVAVSKREAARP